jgi:hypothetical protein
MGFLDKVKGAAKSAKDELDKSGLVDKVKDKAAEQWRAGTDAENPAPAPTDPTTYLVDAIRRGAVDPTLLISQVEVATIAGREVGPARTGFDDTFVSARFESGSGRHFQRLSLFVCHAVDDDGAWDADEYWEFLLETYGGDEVHLPGLGDDAFRQGSVIWAKAVGRIVFADVVGDDVDEATAAQRAERMVRLAVPRLPPLAPA